MSIQFTPADRIPVNIFHKRTGIERYVLSEDLHFENSITSITIDKGFKLDFASVPRFLWAIFPPIDRWARAALVHDALYRWGNVTRIQADALFLTIMEHDGVPKWQRWSMYQAVRKFGAEPWRKLRGEIPREATLTDRLAFSWGMSRSWFKWAILAITLLVVILLGTQGFGQCGPAGCPIGPPAGAKQVGPIYQPAKPAPDVIVRIRHGAGYGNFLGTGTIVKHSGDYSYILTCQHVIEGPGKTYIEAPAIGQVPATIFKVDGPHDLALLRCARVRLPAIQLNLRRPIQGALALLGLGGNGQYRNIKGPIVGYSTPQGATYGSVVVQGGVRSGDSGGPIIDSNGAMVGVLWGSRDGQTYGNVGEPVERILTAIPQQPLVPRQPPVVNTKPLPSPAVVPADCPECERIDKLEADVQSLRQQSQEVTASVEGVRSQVQQGQQQINKQFTGWQQSTSKQIETITQETSSLKERIGQAAVGLAKEAVPTVFERFAIPALVGGLGLGSPLGIAMVIGSFIRRRKVGRGGADQDRFPG